MTDVEKYIRRLNICNLRTEWGCRDFRLLLLEIISKLMNGQQGDKTKEAAICIAGIEEIRKEVGNIQLSKTTLLTYKANAIKEQAISMLNLARTHRLI